MWFRYFDESLDEDRIREDFQGIWGFDSQSDPSLPVATAPDDVPGDKVLRQVNARRGQRKFRENLLTAYENRCAVTGCSIVELLEAAHVEPHSVSGRNNVENGLLLRSDIHTLFDLGLLWIEPTSFEIRLDKRVGQAPYDELNGRKLRAARSGTYPDQELLERRYRMRLGN